MNMSRIKGAHTGPERLVRSLLHRMGYRFRLHRKDLPGRHRHRSAQTQDIGLGPRLLLAKASGLPSGLHSQE